MKKIVPLFILLLGISITNVTAQNSLTRGGSVYSSFGLGTPVDYLSPQASAMGLQGVAVFSPQRPSLANPAFWGNSFFTTISAGMELNYFDASDVTGSSENTNINFTYAQVVIPILKNRLGASLAMFPETQNRFDLNRIVNVDLPSASGPVPSDVEQTISGTGGINRLELGFGARIMDDLFVGYAPSLLFGVTRQDNSFLFDGAAFRTIDYRIQTRHIAMGHRFGVFGTIRNTFRNRDRFDIGATLSLPADLKANRRLINDLGALGTVDIASEEVLGERNISYPLMAALGISYSPTRYLLFSTELLYQQWGDTNNFDPTALNYTTDRMRLGLGLEYNVYQAGNRGLFNSLIYRAGASYDTGHLQIEGKNIETLLLSFGLGIPSRSSGSMLDLSFDYGFRGTESNNLVRERIFAFRVSFNLSEVMFIQRRFN